MHENCLVFKQLLYFASFVDVKLRHIDFLEKHTYLQQTYPSRDVLYTKTRHWNRTVQVETTPQVPFIHTYFFFFFDLV